MAAMFDTAPRTALRSSGAKVLEDAASDAHGCNKVQAYMDSRYMFQPWMHLDAKKTCLI